MHERVQCECIHTHTHTHWNEKQTNGLGYHLTCPSDKAINNANDLMISYRGYQSSTAVRKHTHTHCVSVSMC